QSKEKHQSDLAQKKRFQRMFADFNAVRTQLDEGRSEALAAERRRMREALTQAREERIAEYRRVKAEKEESEARERAEREEREAREEQEKAAKAAELARLREEMAAQRARDEEALSRRLEAESSPKPDGPKKYVPPSRRQGTTPSAGVTPPQATSPKPDGPKKYVPPALRRNL
ncbi:hypothetical protein GGF43_006256, partial [Coemansia sp. RSA 2618]